jgi:hypothetical protein
MVTGKWKKGWEQERERKRDHKQDIPFENPHPRNLLSPTPSFHCLSIMPSNCESINGLIH